MISNFKPPEQGGISVSKSLALCHFVTAAEVTRTGEEQWTAGPRVQDHMGLGTDRTRDHLQTRTNGKAPKSVDACSPQSPDVIPFPTPKHFTRPLWSCT